VWDLATKIVMPQMGYDMKEGVIVRWLKVEGDKVARGEPIAEIETDKAVVSVEAYVGGVLMKIIANEGVTVLVGDPIGIVGEPDEILPDFKLEKSPGNSYLINDINDMHTKVSIESERILHPNKDDFHRSIKISPLARRLADEKKIDISKIKGTGPEGRITKADIESTTKKNLKTKEARSGGKIKADAPKIELSPMRKSIAFVTTESKQKIPHFYLSIEIDMTEAIKLKNRLNSAKEYQNNLIHINDFIINSCAKTLAKHEKFNSSYNMDHLVVHSTINIGIVVAIPDGLIIPALVDCYGKNLKEIAKLSKGVIERAQEGKLTERDYTETTFSISNLGMYDIDSFFAIINPLNTATLALGTVSQKPVVRGNKIIIADMMTANLSVDHRVADGVEAAKFLNEIKYHLENPEDS